MKRQFRDIGKSILLKMHKAGLSMGLVVLPNHYYTPIADQRRLRDSKQYWARPTELPGVDLDADRQMNWLSSNVAPFEPEYRNNTIYLNGISRAFGPGYGYIEAQCYHGVVRALKPKRIIEIGAGVSTWCAMTALKMNAEDGSPGTMTCIEPYPSKYLREADIELIVKPVEQLPVDAFDVLDAGDILFIDSSHALRPGGDVLNIYLSILPRLKPGVIVHIHDIYFPYMYQRDVLDTLFQWNETALLAALLVNNPKFEVLASLSQLTYDRPEQLKSVFPEYIRQAENNGLSSDVSGHFPSSIYLRTLP